MASRKRGARQPGEPKLMGASQAAKVLGVSQTNLRVQAGLPEPYDKVAGGTLWRADDIAEFARSREAKRKLEAALQQEAAQRAVETEEEETAA
jgi:hypothetical protein